MVQQKDKITSFLLVKRMKTIKTQYLYPLRYLKYTLIAAPCFPPQFLLWSYPFRKKVSCRRNMYAYSRCREKEIQGWLLGTLQSRAKRNLESNWLQLNWKQGLWELCEVLEFNTSLCSSSVFLNCKGFTYLCSMSAMMWRMLKYSDRVCSQFWQKQKPRNRNLGEAVRRAKEQVKSRKRDWFHLRGCPQCFSVELVWFFEEKA